MRHGINLPHLSLFLVEVPESGRIPDDGSYFPIQKFLKIFPSISSDVISPVISPR